MRTKVAEFWKLPDNMAHATKVIYYRLAPDGKGELKWSHVDKQGISHLVYVEREMK